MNTRNHSPLARSLRSVFFLGRIVAPFVWTAVVGALQLIAMAVIALWSGVPASLERMANEWLDRAVLAGWPSLYAPQLYYFFYVIGFGMVVVGWVLCSYLTVFLVGWLIF